MKYLGPETEVLHERYARALFETAKESGKLDEVAGDIAFMNELLRESDELSDVLDHPEIEKDAKIKILEALTRKKKFSAEFGSFLRVLVKKDRLALIHGTFLRYRDLYDREKGRLKAFVRTAVSLSKSHVREFEKVLSRVLKKDVTVIEELTPSLLGGLDVRIGGMVYKRSLKNRLKRMEGYLNQGV